MVVMLHDADPSGPAVSLDGYPRYTPQWGVGLPEKKQSAPPTPIRREPSERAKAVMTRPGSPPYPKTAGGGSKANRSKPTAVPSGEDQQINEQALLQSSMWPIGPVPLLYLVMRMASSFPQPTPPRLHAPLPAPSIALEPDIQYHTPSLRWSECPVSHSICGSLLLSKLLQFKLFQSPRSSSEHLHQCSTTAHIM